MNKMRRRELHLANVHINQATNYIKAHLIKENIGYVATAKAILVRSQHIVTQCRDAEESAMENIPEHMYSRIDMMQDAIDCMEDADDCINEAIDNIDDKDFESCIDNCSDAISYINDAQN